MVHASDFLIARRRFFRLDSIVSALDSDWVRRSLAPFWRNPRCLPYPGAFAFLSNRLMYLVYQSTGATQ